MPATVGPFKNFLRVYYGEVGPLYLSRFSESGNIQRVAKYEFPHVDQQGAEPMGVRPHVITGEMVFLTSLGDKDLYPKRYIELRQTLRNPEPQYFLHPYDGQMLGYITEFNPTHDATARNGCIVQFTFERITDTSETVALDLFKDPLTQAELKAAVADAGLAALSITPPAIGSLEPSETVFSDYITQFRGILDDATSTVDDINATVAMFRDVAQNVLAIDYLSEAENYEVYQAILSMSSLVTQAAEQAASSATQLIEVELKETSSAQEIAMKWYKGDLDRAEQIATLNPTRFFFYPKGMVLRIPDR